MARLDASAFAISDALFSEFKGSFAENYVLQALLSQLDAAPRYWTNEKPKHEVDFLIQVGNEIVPVEVKSGEVVHSKSLKYYADKHAETIPLRVRYSLKNLKLDDGVLNIPLYLADRSVPLIKKALDRAHLDV